MKLLCTLLCFIVITTAYGMNESEQDCMRRMYSWLQYLEKDLNDDQPFASYSSSFDTQSFSERSNHLAALYENFKARIVSCYQEERIVQEFIDQVGPTLQILALHMQLKAFHAAIEAYAARVARDGVTNIIMVGSSKNDLNLEGAGKLNELHNFFMNLNRDARELSVTLPLPSRFRLCTQRELDPKQYNYIRNIYE